MVKFPVFNRAKNHYEFLNKMATFQIDFFVIKRRFKYIFKKFQSSSKSMISIIHKFLNAFFYFFYFSQFGCLFTLPSVRIFSDQSAEPDAADADASNAENPWRPLDTFPFFLFYFLVEKRGIFIFGKKKKNFFEVCPSHDESLLVCSPHHFYCSQQRNVQPSWFFLSEIELK